MNWLAINNKLLEFIQTNGAHDKESVELFRIPVVPKS